MDPNIYFCNFKHCKKVLRSNSRRPVRRAILRKKWYDLNLLLTASNVLISVPEEVRPR